MMSSGSDTADATRARDRRLFVGSASASARGGYLAPAPTSHGGIWYSGESSSTSCVMSSTPTTSSSSEAVRHDAGDTSPDDEPRHRLHRSSPLSALNSIYVDDQHLTGKRSPACCRGGVVNAGFVGDGILTDSWRRVSWRARLRAGIARSTVSSDPGPTTSNPPHDASSRARRRPTYLSDVIHSVTFFSNAGGGNAGAHARREFPLTDTASSRKSLARCESDGGEWTMRDRSARPSSLVSNGRLPNDQRINVSYCTHVRPPADSTRNQHADSRVVECV